MSVFAAARPDRRIVQRTVAQTPWRGNLALPQSIAGSQKLHATGHLFGLQHPVDQHQTANDLSNRTFLSSIYDAGMAGVRRRQSQEIIILREDDPAFVSRPSQLLAVRGSQRSRFGNGQDIHASAAKAHDDRLGTCSSVKNRTLAMSGLIEEFLGEPRNVFLTQDSDQRLAFCDPLVDIRTVIEIIGQGCMHVGQRQVVLRSYVIGALAETFVPDGDVRNRDATARDPRLAAAHARRNRDVLIHGFRSYECTSICGPVQLRGAAPSWPITDSSLALSPSTVARYQPPGNAVDP